MKIESINTFDLSLYIPNQGFTQEALDLFDIIRQKLKELCIEPNEAKNYFLLFIEKIREIGLIPPLIINLLRDVDNNYKTLIVSRNLSAEEEKIIAACIKPTIIGTNEILPQTESKDIIISPKELVFINDFSNPYSAISMEIYKEVIKCTQGNEEVATEFTKKAMNAFEKISRTPPVSAVNSLPEISKTLFEQLRLQVNPPGILAYLQKYENGIKSSILHLQ